MPRAIERQQARVAREQAGPPPHCPRCCYSLFRSASERCPECGVHVAKLREILRLRAEARELRRTARAAWWGDWENRIAQGLDWLAAAAAAGAAGVILYGLVRAPELCILLIALLTLAVPTTYYQWATGVSTRSVWGPLAVVWWCFVAWGMSICGFRCL